MEVGPQVDAISRQGRMRADPQLHEEVTGRATVAAGGTAAAEPEARSIIAPGRHVAHERPLLAAAALAPAFRAGRRYVVTGAAAVGARAGRDHLAEQGLA